MNSQLHRVVFNRTRGNYMVVQETAASASGRTGQTRRRRAAQPPALANALRAVACAAALVVGAIGSLHDAQAQTLPLTPHAGAPAGQRPLMDAAANGVPIVHIAPPSAAGVSRNLYTDFNVERRGLILNNAAGSTQTQLGGWVAGNPQLGYVPAKVIVNEVLGTQRSQLLGAIEVAGRKADLVIANPNGLVVDGLAFINTDRAVLGTGVPQYGAQGALQGIKIRTGLIEVGAQGLDATSLEQLDLLARGLAIGGEVWARRLHVVAGGNDVGYARLGQAPEVTPSSAADGSAAPMFAVDVKQLGAMFAGQVYLLATERGLGVNSTGRLAALQGNLTLSVDGQLSLADSHGALGVNLASTGDMVLGGSVSTAMQVDGSRAGDIVLNSGGVLRQAGKLDAAGTLSLEAAELHHTGSTVQRDPMGSLSLTVAGAAHTSGVLHSTGSLKMVAGHLHDTSGRWQAQRSLRIEAGELQLDGSEITSAADARLVARDGELHSKTVQVVAQGPLNVVAAGRWTNMAGAWQARAGITARAADIRNAGGTVVTSGQLDLAATGQLDNSEGQLLGAAGVSIRAGLLRNEGTAGRPAEVSSDADVRLSLDGAMSNRDGLVSAKRSIDVVLTDGLLDNSGGALLSDGTLSLQAASVVNRSGQIVSTLTPAAAAAAGIATGVTLQAGSLDNSQGLVSSASDVTVLARQGLINTQGLVVGDGAVSVDAAAGRLDNAGGTIAAGRALRLNADELLNRRDAAGRSAMLSAGTDLLATAGRIENDGSGMTAQHSLQLQGSSQGLSNLDGTLAAGGALSLLATQIDNQRGNILSNQAVSLTAAGLGNQAGRISAPQVRIALGQGLLDNEQGSLIAGGDLTPAEPRSLWLTQGRVNNRGGVITTGGALSLDTQGREFDNAGGLVRAAGMLDVVVGTLINSGGLIDGRSDVSVNAIRLQGAGGRVQAGADGDVTVQGDLLLDGGSLQAGRDLRVEGASLRQSKSGLIVAGREVRVSARQLVNHGADIVGGGSVTLAGLEGPSAVALVLDNREGRVFARESLRIDAASLVNDFGRIEAGTTLRLDSDSLSNLGGTITAAGPTDVVSRGVVSNAGGEISSASTLRLDTGGAALDNRAGRLIADQALQLAAGMVDNTQGAIASTEGALHLRATRMSNTAGVVSAGQALDLGLAQALDNRGGMIGAGGDLRVDAGAGGVDNTSGRLQAGVGREEATGSLVLDTRGLLLNVDTGRIVAGRDARIQAASIRNSGVVSSSGRTHLMTGDLANSGLFQAVGSLTLALSGALDNQGLLQSGDALGISASALRNHRPPSAAPAGSATFAQGLIASNGAMELGIRGELLNEGAEVAAQAALTLRADAVRNEAGSIGANGPLLVSTVHAIVNTHRADLQSLADVRIEAGRVENSGASRMLAGGALQLQASGEWVNDQSTLASVGALSARGSAISNRAGEIVGQGGVDLRSARLDNAAGRIAAGRSGDVPQLADLRIDTAGQALVNDGGSLRATGNVRLLAGPLINRGGHVLAGRALEIDASGTDNDVGVLVAGGAATLRSGALRNEGGEIHAERLLIDTLGPAPAQSGAGVLDNTRGRIVGSGALSLSAGELINVQGLVTSHGRTVLRTGVFTNDDGALAAQALDLHASGQLVNAGGLIQSGSDLTLRAEGLSNRRSTKRKSSEAGKTPGLIKAAGDADIVVSQTATNHGGQILAGGTLHLQAERLSNDAGVLQAEGAKDARLILAVRDAVSNQAGGLIQAQHGLQLQTGIVSNAGGSVASPGTATLVVGSWFNGDGALQAADVSLGASGVVANAGGSIGASRDLTLTAQSLYSTASDLGVQSQVLAGRDLTLTVADQMTTVQTLVRGERTVKIEAGGLVNDQGQIESMGSLNVAVQGTLSNREGIIRTEVPQSSAASLSGAPSSTLAMRAGKVDNAGGLLDAATDLDMHTGQLVNTGGRMQARGASFVLDAGHTSNVGGAMVSAGHLRATTLSFDNSGGSLSASQALHLDTQAHTLTNRATAGGSATIVAGGDALLSVATLDNLQDAGAQATVAAQALSLRAIALNNTGSILAGRIGRDGTLDLQTAGTLDNDGGLLSAFGQLNVSAGELLNRGGALLAATGNGGSRPSLVLSAARVDNGAGGRISALHGNASIVTGTGDYLNRAGLTSAAGDLDLLVGLLDNTASATLQAGGVLHATTMALHNGEGGWIHGNDVTLDTRGWTLRNASGALGSAGGLTMLAGGLDNRGGSVAALGQLALTIGGTVDNTRGMLSGAQGLRIDAAAQQVLNTGGTVKSAAGSVAVAAARIDNDAGALVAAHDMTLAATQSISNRATVLDGSSVGGRIAGRDLEVASPLLDNHGGRMAADRDAVLHTQATDNTGGDISARRNLSLSAPTLINTGGTVTADGLLALSTASGNPGARSAAPACPSISTATTAMGARSARARISRFVRTTSSTRVS
ncbi:filamentous hemagglutinin N-terminal domain-containing protein [Aquincola sp. J276]|uniref:two-partner secretion domain-containing protein n=1 Tax=Aquincola sp. J276 TaxID=2898432 RepID=UPI00215086DE|nr:filamentous hemagglutinin N-terminal domain-containing protein [Aquincola sp. J276]MCR5865174.1 filamentous hemagglutinin N-terminal domain-containing protein [Aquincola sp. J276]